MEIEPRALLPTIGKRGASSFIFEKSEPVNIALAADIMGYRNKLNLTIREFSTAFGFSTTTVQKIETGKITANEAIKRLRIYVNFPETALWEIEQNKSKLHWKTYELLKSMLEIDLSKKPTSKKWGNRWGLNPRHSESQSDALPTELRLPQSLIHWFMQARL